MGKVVSRIWQKGGLGGFGAPAAREGLLPLVGWSRENLVSVVEDFRRMPKASFVLDLNSFWRIFQFESRGAAEEAFNALKTPKQDKGVDFLPIIGAMVATSDQRFISKVSFLFSVYDLDSSGSINRAEFFIGARSLITGLGRFFASAAVPPREQLEQGVNEVFNQIDDDRSGLLMLGELIAFAYRCSDLQALLAPFPADDARLFEELLVFTSVGEPVAKASASVVRSVTEKIQYKVSVTPDPRKRLSQGGVARPKERLVATDQQQQRAWKAPKNFSRAQCWVMWRVFKSLAGEQSEVLASSELRAMLADDAFIARMLDNITRLALERIGGIPEALSNADAGNAASKIEEDKASVRKLVAHLQTYFKDPGAIRRLDAMGEGSISMCAFFCVILPHMPESGIESCLAWCRKFVAHKLLCDILLDPAKKKEDWEVVEALFRAIDKDSDGSITIEELCNEGMIRKEDGEKLIVNWDKDGSGNLDSAEVKSVLFRMDSSLRSAFRDAFTHDPAVADLRSR